MLTVQLRSRAASVGEVAGWMGKHLPRSAAKLLIRGETTVFKPDGEKLLTYLPGALKPDVLDAAYPFLHSLRPHTTRNRGAYGGMGREQPIRKSGVRSNTNEAPPVRSCVVGSFDRYPRIPFCRQLALSSKDPNGWAACLPMTQAVARFFEQYAPHRYREQEKVAKATHPAYVIPGTPFTTLTVNNCVAGALHTDKGDYGPGFGVIAVLRRGFYQGGELVFPAFGCGADLAHGDVILFDAHEPHGNLPIFAPSGEEGRDWERCSIVFYFRERMTECGSPAQELERAKGLHGAFEAFDDSPTDQT